MTSPPQVDRFVGANRRVRQMALTDLRAIFDRLPADPAVAAALLAEAVPAVVERYGNIAAVAAGEMYEAMRADANAPGQASTRLAATVPPDAVRINTRWAVGPLFSEDRAGAWGRLEQITDRMALQPGRDTIARSVEADTAGARWARVPYGKTCAWCLMLASRGPVYRSEQSAGGARSWHSHCDCTPTPVWPDQPLPKDFYDPEALYEKYLDARDASGSSSTKTILAELRQLEGIH